MNGMAGRVVGRPMVRPRRGRWVAGVCAALADRFGMPRGLMRLLFVVSTLLPGPQFVVYIVLWIMIPGE